VGALTETLQEKGSELMADRTKTSSTGKIDRRTVLRGVGVTMCLPWLESLSVFAATPGGAAFPKRFAVFFMGNGINENHWGGDQARRVRRRDNPVEGSVDMRRR